MFSFGISKRRKVTGVLMVVVLAAGTFTVINTVGMSSANAATYDATAFIKCSNTGVVYRRGSTGYCVRVIQFGLQKAGWRNTTIDGSFGPITEANVQGFKYSVGYDSTQGTVGHYTMLRLLDAVY